MDSDCLLEQYFFQSNGCFLQLRIHRFCTDAQLFCYLCIGLFFFADADEDFTATFRQAVKRLDVKSE